MAKVLVLMDAQDLVALCWKAILAFGHCQELDEAPLGLALRLPVWLREIEGPAVEEFLKERKEG